jgi:hypothetical protein
LRLPRHCDKCPALPATSRYHSGQFPPVTYRIAMKLEQGQVWKQGDQYLRITQLERMKVGYKTMKSLATRDGHHRELRKKEFCRLIKTAALLTPIEVLEASAR